MTILLLVLIGFSAGIASGIFGIGGGIIIVPGLTFLLGFSQHRAIGTSLVILLPPVGLAAVIEYHRNGNVDVKAAVIVAVMLFLGAWTGAVFANRLSAALLQTVFGVFVIVVGLYTAVNGYRNLYGTNRSEVKSVDLQK